MKKTLIKTLILAIFVVCTNVVATMALGWVNDGGGSWSYVDADGDYAKGVIKASGKDKFYLDENGFMVRDYLLEDYNDAIYYFDDTGKMVMNTWVAVEPMQVLSPMENPPTIYLYYFGSNGKAYRAKNSIVKKTIDGKKYLFNSNGQMLSGWINEDGERFDEYNTEEDPFVGYCYYAGDETDGVLREGWAAYEEGSVEDRYYLKNTLWFYFKRSDNKKVQAANADTLFQKVINGNTYAFDDNGVMVVGWDSDTLDPQNNKGNTVVTRKYYEEEDGDNKGKMSKRRWAFVVPSMKQNLDDYEQEIQRWFYTQASGEVIKGMMKKVNKEYYAFNDAGIMKTGVCVINKSNKSFVDCIDAERTDGKDFIISRNYISKEKESGASEFELFDSSTQALYYFAEDTDELNTLGKRVTGEHKVAFGDDDYSFYSKPSGQYEGLKNNKYYQNGLGLRPDPALGYGLVFVGYSLSNAANHVDFPPMYMNVTAAAHPWAKPDTYHGNRLTDYIVINKDYSSYTAPGSATPGVYPVFVAIQKNGTRLSKPNNVKKDKAGNYWLIGDGGYVVNIYNVPVRKHMDNGRLTWQFKSEISAGTAGAKPRTEWIDFSVPGVAHYDEYGRTCYASRVEPGTDNPGDYVVNIDDSYCVNFRLED